MSKKVKIKEFAQVVNGSTPSTKNPEYYDGDIIWITPKDLSEQNSKYILKGERTITQDGYKSCSTQLIPPGNILMSSRAPIGLLSINKEECCTNQGFKSLVIDSKKCSTEFLYYYLKYHIKEIEALGSGTTFKEVSKDSMENYEIELPDIALQNSIASVLKAIDEKIINNNAINNELESMAKTIYDYWFLQFEFPNTEGKPYKSFGGKMVWNEELKREIPEGWGVKSLDIISDYQNGFAFYKEGYDSSGAKVVDLGNVNLLGLYIDTKDDKYISLERYDNEKYKNYRLKKNDLIMIMTDRKSTMDLLGKTGRIYKDDKYLLNQRVARIRCHDDFNVNYLYATLNGTFINDILKGRALGSVQKYINSGDITTLPILIPSENIMKKFGSIVDEMYQKMDENLQENEELASLRDFLLPLLMNGQVGFKE